MGAEQWRLSGYQFSLVGALQRASSDCKKAQGLSGQAGDRKNFGLRQPIFRPAVARIEWMSTRDPVLLSFLKDRLENWPRRIPPVYQGADFPATLSPLPQIAA